jgi:two-component system, LuxR family, sensor kinase FixL
MTICNFRSGFRVARRDAGNLQIRLVLWKITSDPPDAARETAHLRQNRSMPADAPLRPEFLRDNATFELIFESSPVAMIIVDAQGRMVLVNEQTTNWFGYAREELLGREVEVLIPERFRARHPGLRESYFADAHERQMGGGLELFARRKDGSEFPVDISLHPLRINGETVVLAHLVDIADRKAAEEQATFRKLLEQMQFMVEHLPAGAVYVSPDRILMNRAVETITGYQRDEITTLDEWFARLYGERAAEIRELYLADRAGGFPESRTVELIRKSGEIRHVQFAGHAYDDHEVWLVYDLTDLKHAQDRLIQSERLAAIGQMMAALAHESRNAIQRAQACLDMLELDVGNRPELLDLTVRAKRALDELHRLYEEVRGYAAPIKLDRQPCDLRALCRDVWAQIRETHTDKSIEFQLETGDAWGSCVVDKPRIAQVVRNILENSYAACSDGGSIRIRCDQAKLGGASALRISFRDDGSGLSDEQRQKLFAPFYSTKPKGTGLGMAIAKRIVEAHHGEIGVAVPDGPGAEIVVTLPR